MQEIKKSKMPRNLSLTEPIIVSGKYFGIKLLSAYDFMLCTKMSDNLAKYMTKEGFDKSLSSKIGERACIVAMCLYDEKNQKIFTDGLEVLKNLTPENIEFIYNEYDRLLKKIVKRDKTINCILENIKKKRYLGKIKTEKNNKTI